MRQTAQHSVRDERRMCERPVRWHRERLLSIVVHGRLLFLHQRHVHSYVYERRRLLASVPRHVQRHHVLERRRRLEPADLRALLAATLWSLPEWWRLLAEHELLLL